MGGLKIDLVPSLNGQSVRRYFVLFDCALGITDNIPHCTNIYTCISVFSQMAFGMYTRQDQKCGFKFALWHERMVEKTTDSK